LDTSIKTDATILKPYILKEDESAHNAIVKTTSIIRAAVNNTGLSPILSKIVKSNIRVWRQHAALRVQRRCACRLLAASAAAL
jgi:hypothetical protein